MKNIIALLTILVSIQFGQAQTIMGNFGIGYNSSFVKAEMANTIINKYNSTRSSILTKPMGNLKYMDGISLNMNYTYLPYIIDFNFNKRKNELYSQGNGNSGPFQRDLKFKSNNFGLGFGLILTQDAPFIGFGFNLDAGANSIDTRIGNPSVIEDMDYEDVLSQITIGGSFWGQVMICNKSNSGIGLIIRPYYHFEFLKTNYTWLNETLNPTTYLTDGFDHYDKMNHFGIQILVVMIIPDFY